MLSRWKTVLLLSYLCMASLSAAILTPALPMIEQSYHLSHGAVEWVMTLFLLGYTLGQLVYGPISIKFSSLWALRCGLIINVLGIGLCMASSMFHCFILLLVGRFVSALGAASGLTCTFALIHHYFSKEASGAVFSFAMVSFTLGIGIAIGVGGVLTDFFSWEACFYFLLIHGVVMWVLSWQLPSVSQEKISLCLPAIIKNYVQVLKSIPLVGWSFAVAMPTVFGYCFTTMAPTYVYQVLHVSIASYAGWNTLNMLGMLASGLLSRFLLKRYQPLQVLKMMFIATVPGLLSFFLLSYTEHSSLLWFMVGSIWLYIFTGASYAASSWLATTSVSDTASASSMMSFINMMCAVLSVMIMGYIHASLLFAFCYVVIGFFVVSALVVLYVGRTRLTAQ